MPSRKPRGCAAVVSPPSVDRLREILRYEPETGCLIWVRPYQLCFLGQQAGSVDTGGYLRLQIDYCRLVAHRVVWAIFTGEWPDHEIDHINGNRSDNRFENLRPATAADNARNRSLVVNSVVGLRGVSMRASKSSKPFSSRITANGLTYSLGYFKTAEEAHTAYIAASMKHFGQFAGVRRHAIPISRMPT